MDSNGEQGSRKRRGTRPTAPVGPHHISAIAHHFLPEFPPDSAPESPETRTPDPEADGRLCVAAPHEARLAAFAAAGLVDGLRREVTSVLLSEAAAAEWSAAAYLAPEALSPAPSLAESGSAPPAVLDPSPQRSWMHVGADTTDAEQRSAHVRYLGRIDEAYLEWAEAGTAFRTESLGATTAAGGLVWCLRDGRDLSWTSAQLLGRTMAALQPIWLEVLVFPPAWPRHSRRGWPRRLLRSRPVASKASEDEVQQFAARTACLLPDCDVHATRLQESSDRNGPPAGFAHFAARIVRRSTGPHSA